MYSRAKAWVKRLKFRWLAPRVSKVPHRWEGTAPDCTDALACIFVTYAPGGVIPEHAKIHYEAWKAAGFVVALVVCLDDLAEGLRNDAGQVDALMLRSNRGYDFGAWANAITAIPTLPQARLCVIANDSVYGPLHDLADIANRMLDADADVIGLVASSEGARHYQSFLLGFKPSAMNSRFWNFWTRVRQGGREDVIQNYELRLTRIAERYGLKGMALYSGEAADANPTLTAWRGLIRDGFPYVKVQLLRDNPRHSDLTGWRSTMLDHRYDPGIVDRHLGQRTAL